MDNLKKHFTPKELLEIFPKAVPSIKRNLAMWRRIKKDGEKIYSEMLNIALDNLFVNYQEQGFRQEALIQFAQDWFYNEPMEKIEKHIRELSYLLQLTQQKRTPKGQITDTDIRTAKLYPIEDLSPTKPNQSGFINCPFHNEKTPSCKINKKNNRWHCFGCGRDGDAIDFVMELEGLDFISAIKRLTTK